MEALKKKVGRAGFGNKRDSVSLDELKSGLLKIAGTAKLIDEERAKLHAARLVRDARNAAHLSQAELAQKLDITQGRVSQMESGAGSYGLSVVLLERVAKACGGVLNLSFDQNSKTSSSHG